MMKTLEEEQDTSQNQIDIHLASLFNSLQEELIAEFSTKEKEKLYHIYTNYQKKQQKLELFIRLNRNTEVNPTKQHIHFIITITHLFPAKPPYVVFASYQPFPSLNDQRNLLTCLHPEWKPDSTVSTIINNMASFIKGYQNDQKNSLFISYGAYKLDNHVYSINDFLSNSNNMLRKVKLIINLTDCLFEDYYMVITDVFLLLFAIDEEDKSKGWIAFLSELKMIDGTLRVHLDKENKFFEDKIGFHLLWKENAFSCDYGFIIEQKQFKEFQDELMRRNALMSNTFSLFLNNDGNTTDSLQKMIMIKEAFLEEVYDWFTFTTLLELYQKLVEMSPKEDVVTHVLKLQLLLKKYKQSSASSIKKP